MQVNQIMTADVEGIASHESALQAAQQMARRDVGRCRCLKKVSR